MNNLYDTPRHNAEGYCRKCGASLGISGQCVICAVNELDMRFKPKLYTLGAPSAELAAEVQRDLYEQARSGVVDYGAISPIQELIIQFQESASNMNQILSGLQQTVNQLVTENKRLKVGMSPTAAVLSQQEADKDAAELTLRTQLAAAQLPPIEDVYVVRSKMFYVTFRDNPSREQVNRAAGLQLRMERTQPLINRWRVVFEPTDTDED